MKIGSRMAWACSGQLTSASELSGLIKEICTISLLKCLKIIQVYIPTFYTNKQGVALIDNKVTCLTTEKTPIYMQKVEELISFISQDPTSIHPSNLEICNIINRYFGYCLIYLFLPRECGVTWGEEEAIQLQLGIIEGALRIATTPFQKVQLSNWSHTWLNLDRRFSSFYAFKDQARLGEFLEERLLFSSTCLFCCHPWILQ